MVSRLLSNNIIIWVLPIKGKGDLLKIFTDWMFSPYIVKKICKRVAICYNELNNKQLRPSCLVKRFW
jgi:hypothetical protein